ncbi:hypothetical protein MCOR27_004589 [Pyricularia oryzae]|uniref:Uncharacterized protein n=2 Tax=Pyricularia TaxID=48558 RepID=A0ABQ8N2S1_PYRGI|nr:hypothetical protein MCOR19_006908 [Pyricularia oryzae]KAI6290239.1 hypothetical protein MCOR33_011411 [Pyricularia grisea]KAI6280666.1 hypothetical protein MCOR27_004589 [Pyricularia oryzae]KAI6316424.1 hypothetical protein MCOR30_009319 [Pyricularia oryzae]KAI6325603.1 hypothetical protein MCOR29_003734 [Pyricularia oryzae]
MPPVTRASKARQEALAKENNEPIAKRKAARKKAQKGPLVEETPAKKRAADKAAQSAAGTKTTAGRATKKKAAGSAAEKQAEPPASTPSAPAAAPVKAKSKPKPAQAVKGNPTTEKLVAPKKPATEKPALAKKPAVETAKPGPQPAKRKVAANPAPSNRARCKRVRWTATATVAQAEPRWAKKSKDDDEDEEESDDEVEDEVQDKPGVGSVKDKKRYVPENKVANVKAKPAAPVAESVPKAISKKLALRKPNEKVAIPEDLKSVVKRSSDGTTFDCKIPAREHKKGELLLWALKENPKAVNLQLRLNPLNTKQAFAGFRFALSFRAGTNPFKYGVGLCDATKEWTTGNAGARLDNFLALVMSRDLHAALHDDASSDPSATLSKVVKVVQSVLSAISFGTECIVCSKPFNTTVWRPVACSPDCREVMATWPLELLVSPLLLDHLALDLLLGCIYTEHFGERVAGMANLPARAKRLKWSDMVHALNTFPKLHGNMTLEFIEGADAGSPGRRSALFWLSFAFPGCLVSASQAATVQYVPTTSWQPGQPQSEQVHQFVLLNSTVERQVAFRARGTQAGEACFHGTPHQNLLPILADGLRQTRGRYVPIWFGYCFGKSDTYQRNMTFQSWPNSVFGGCCIIFGIENRGPAGKPHYFLDSFAEGFTKEQSELMVRNVFVYKRPVPSDFLLGSQTRDVMEKTFCLIEEQRAEEVRGPAQLHSEMKV